MLDFQAIIAPVAPFGEGESCPLVGRGIPEVRIENEELRIEEKSAYASTCLATS
jgi:hypothetical protein